MAKKAKIGSVIVNKKDKHGNPLVDNNGNPKSLVSLALGNQSENPIYATSVEITVKDGNGKVLHKQTNGFINLIDPRTQPDDLLAAGLISEEVANNMKNNVSKMSEKVRYVMEVPIK